MRRAAISCVVAALASTLAMNPSPSGADDLFTFERLAGVDRYATAAAIATAVADTGDKVLVATGETYPDALASAYLAGRRSAPILLTTRDTLPAVTADALRTLGARSVTVLGGTAAVGDAVVDELRAAGHAVDRIAGTDRYETARLVAQAAGATAVGTVDGKKTAIVTGGDSFAEATAAGPLSYQAALPLLLTTVDRLSADTASALQSLQIEHVLVLGGTAQVGDATVTEIEGLGMTVQRLGSAERTVTAAAIADYALTSLGFPATRVNLARGDAFADALAGGPLGGSVRAVTLLASSSSTLGAATAAWLGDHAESLTGGAIFGGTAAISESVEEAATTAAGGQARTGAAGSASVASVAITGGLADGAATTDTTPTYSGTATATEGIVQRVTVAIDGGTPGTVGVRCTGCGTNSARWELTPTAALAEGRHTIALRAIDASGSASSPASTSVVVDLTAPTFVDIAAARGSTLVTAEFDEPMRCSSITADDFDAELAGDAVNVSEVRCAGVTAPTFGVIIGRTGAAGDVVSLRLVGSVTDAAGNAAALRTRTTEVGNAGAPEVEVHRPADGAHTYIRRPLFEGRATSGGAVAAIEVRLGTKPFSAAGVTCSGCPAAAVSWSHRPINSADTNGYLAEGTYTLQIRARDDAGAFSDIVSRTFTIDATAPQWPFSGSPAPLEATAGSTTVTANFIDANGVDCGSVDVGDFTATVADEAIAITAVSCAPPASNTVHLTLATAPTALQTVELTIAAMAIADRAGNAAPGFAESRSVTV